MIRKMTPGSGNALRALALAVLTAGGCGGILGGPITGGESHFLRSCISSCGGGLDCVSGVCTRGCVVNQESCDDLVTSAVCTDQSIEPGAVAVCDVACATNADCAMLGSTHRCQDGYCRGASVSALDGAGGSASTGTGGTGGSTVTAAPGNVAYPCPANLTPDNIDIRYRSIRGDRLVLEVGYSGGCQEHEVGLCYEASFDESYPVQGELRVVHNANGDNCEAYLSETLEFDLSPYAQYYYSLYPSAAGIIVTPLGTYAFGELQCEERDLAARLQSSDATANIDLACQADSDCLWASNSTECTARCGTIGTTASQPRLGATLQSINDSVCGNYEADGCGPLLSPPCVAPSELACVAGQCVEQ